MRKDFIRSIGLLSYRVVRVNKKLMFDFGNAAAVLRGQSKDREGNPIPWFTYRCRVSKNSLI